jgi:hypothetical protein
MTSFGLMKRIVLTLALAVAPAALLAQKKNPDKLTPKPTVPAITAADLMTRVYQFADDSMMGRQTGTVYHDKGTDYIARELARLGLKPAGENGTYFQRLPIVIRNLAQGTKLVADGKEFTVGKDFIARDARDLGANAREMQNAPVVYGGVYVPPPPQTLPDTTAWISRADAAGKVVIFTVPSGWQANRGLLSQFYANSAGVVLATLDAMPPEVREQLSQPSGPTLGGGAMPVTFPGFFYATQALAETMLGAPLAGARVGQAGKTLSGSVNYSETPSPGARNVIAILEGSDPKLRGQYVAIGAHSDHDGFTDEPLDHDSVYAFNHVARTRGADDQERPATAEELPKIQAKWDSLKKAHAARKDSIMNGADDDGSGSMGVLEVAEAFATAKDKPKRSILFVWHVAEEQGLVGASYFTDHPTVPRDSIVAQINIDMIGRGSAEDTPGGGPGYVQLIGSKRLSTELGAIVEAEGKKGSPVFKFDYQYDANGHPDQYYCRSDHYAYARYGIPVVFLSTGGHAEYHQVTDEPQYLDYDQMARVTNLVMGIAKNVANLGHRVVVDGPKPNPTGQCRQ